MGDAKPILYVSAQLPKRSETFVYREVLALRAAGQDVRVASVHPPERNLGEPELDALADEALPVYGPGLPRLFLDWFCEVLTRPLRTVATFWRAHRDAWGPDGAKGFGIGKVFVQTVAGVALARRVRPLGLAHIHAHMAHVPATIAMYAAHQLGIRFSFTGHAADLFRDRSLLTRKLQAAAFVCCISEWHREFYRSLVPRPDTDYPVVRCGIDTNEFAVRERAPADPRPPLILGVGRLVPKKGFDLLLDALAGLRDAGVPFRAVIGGDGPEAEALAQQRERLGLVDRVELPGALANRAVRGLLGEAAVFVLPCRVDGSGDRDGIPVVLMEAMACGVPVISGDLPAIRELVADRTTGHLVPPGDATALRSTLAELLGPASLGTELGRRGRARVEQEFSAAVNTARLRAALHRVLNI